MRTYATALVLEYAPMHNCFDGREKFSSFVADAMGPFQEIVQSADILLGEYVSLRYVRASAPLLCNQSWPVQLSQMTMTGAACSLDLIR